MRDMIFVSHASEDFEFTQWIVLQLAKEGYGVWCDLTKLLGGENWPKEINDALQTRTQKFLFVLSKTSNKKEDPLNELEVARKISKREELNNFIVPLKLDEIGFDELDFRLQNIQAISFQNNWARGSANLLEILGRDKTLKHPSFSPSSVSSWWRKYVLEKHEVHNKTETLTSNRFQIILPLPERVYAHNVATDPNIIQSTTIPMVPYKSYLISFANADHILNEFTDELPTILKSHELKFSDLLDGVSKIVDKPRDGKYLITRLLNLTFKIFMKTRELKEYKLSKSDCYYFDQAVLPDGKILHTKDGELNSMIRLWGKAHDETWHWAIQAQVASSPNWHYSIRPHILVSGPKGTRSAPKQVYKSWHNGIWRNRMRATVLHLCKDTSQMIIPVGGDQQLCILSDSEIFLSPVSYDEPNQRLQEDSDDIK